MPGQKLDFGQAQIQVFNSAVSSGQIRYDASAARQAAQLYDRAVETLKSIRDKLRDAENAQGFGGFQTGKELQSGFAKKAQDGGETLAHLIDGALQLKEVYLRAGGLIQEADKTSADRINQAQSYGISGEGLA
ncbi:hypothetical protein AB0L57_29620 [Nocardia sp. NPDC052254]|uniref:hypothetical protein n=1 Tax=Nocardia sp. NPDC052254 TaxID=3155681 RepID=UPI0034486EBC